MLNGKIAPDVACSSRVRLARNLSDYPFPPVLDDAGRQAILGTVGTALDGSGFSKDSKIGDALYLHALSEQNIVSREFADDRALHALYTDAGKTTSIMVCEEDHLRIQGFAHGLDLDTAAKHAFGAEQLLDGHIRFAFDKELGYLTHCPTNLGTAMRASVMLFLPALTMTNRMGELKSQLEKIGVTIRGLYGEGSSADAFMYQVSNSRALGIAESDLLRKIDAVVKQIAADECSARDALFRANHDLLTDKIMRSLGILRYATMLSGKEFCDCYAYVRLGVSLGLVEDVTLETLDKLLYAAMPANILLRGSNTAAAKNPVLRDKLRARIVRGSL